MKSTGILLSYVTFNITFLIDISYLVLDCSEKDCLNWCEYRMCNTLWFLFSKHFLSKQNDPQVYVNKGKGRSLIDYVAVNANH